MNVTCSCTITQKDCLFLYGHRTLLDETKTYGNDQAQAIYSADIQAIYVSLSDCIDKWAEKYHKIQDEHNHVSLKLEITIDSKTHVFHGFSTCRLVSHTGIALNGIPAVQARSRRCDS